MVMASGLEWKALANFSSLDLSAASARCCWVMSRRVVTLQGWSSTVMRRLEITQVSGAPLRWLTTTATLLRACSRITRSMRCARSTDSAHRPISSAVRPITWSVPQPKVWVNAGLISMNWPVSWRVTQIGSGLTWNRLANFSSEALRRCSRSTWSVMSSKVPAMRSGLPCSSRYSRARLSM
ncbi:hypothetical protein D3C75_703170 [compost metagenome]